MSQAYRYRSFFWPAVLILIGLVALLVNTGQITVDRLYLLLELWPLILIVVGLELIVRRTMEGRVAELAAALIVLLAVAGAAGYVAVAPDPSATHTMDAFAPAANVDQASLELNAGAATINVSGADLGTDLYRAHIEYSGPKPTADFDRSAGKVTIAQSNDSNVFATRKFKLSLQLSAAVPWRITENTGAASDTLNLSRLRVASLSLNTGASREDVTLGPPSGAVHVDVNGGALTVHVHRPSGVPASINVSGGVVSLTADGHGYHAIGSVSYASPGFDAATDRYQITVNGGTCTATLESWGLD